MNGDELSGRAGDVVAETKAEQKVSSLQVEDAEKETYLQRNTWTFTISLLYKSVRKTRIFNCHSTLCLYGPNQKQSWYYLWRHVL